MKKGDAGFYKAAGLINRDHSPVKPLTPVDYAGHKAMPMIPLAPEPTFTPKPIKMPKFKK